MAWPTDDKLSDIISYGCWETKEADGIREKMFKEYKWQVVANHFAVHSLVEESPVSDLNPFKMKHNYFFRPDKCSEEDKKQLAKLDEKAKQRKERKERAEAMKAKEKDKPAQENTASASTGASKKRAAHAHETGAGGSSTSAAKKPKRSKKAAEQAQAVKPPTMMEVLVTSMHVHILMHTSYYAS